MNITAEGYGHAVILNIKGEIISDTLDAFRQAVDHQLEGKEVVDLLFNLEAVPFVDSDALEYMLDLQDRLAERLGQVKLIRPDENVQKILEITRLEPAFEVFADANEAVKAIQT
jgi:stage II sporulation protein AA (anti-sigma F factor antagonist)